MVVLKKPKRMACLCCY